MKLPPFTRIESVTPREMAERLDFACEQLAKDFKPTDADYDLWENRYLNMFIGLSPPERSKPMRN